ncbi:uncharacterized protein LOC123706025 [Colias croceus]|uniref:uncharacterized protein LOC123706025 n=1 Tax=Colias crocea TaxID=72248 RepID=UPI001E27E955|nr:uncharacterized protein LOC123706025 [Colias croceus]
MYQATMRLSGKKSYSKRPLKNKEGQFVVTSEGQLRRWTLDINAAPPNEREVESVIQSLKNGKAPGADLITAEMLKADIETAVKYLTPLIQKMWNSEELPEDWNKGVLVTVPKKGDLSNCNNWRGVRQGCLLSPLLFLIVLDGIMLDTTVNNRRVIEWGLTDTLEDLDYADDLCLFSHTREDMQAKLNDLQREATKRGLKVNTRKTQEMRCGETSSQPLRIDSECVERVNQFTYLGSVVTENGGTEEDIVSSIAKARAIHSFFFLPLF